MSVSMDSPLAERVEAAFAAHVAKIEALAVEKDRLLRRVGYLEAAMKMGARDAKQCAKGSATQIHNFNRIALNLLDAIKDAP